MREEGTGRKPRSGGGGGLFYWTKLEDGERARRVRARDEDLGQPLPIATDDDRGGDREEGMTDSGGAAACSALGFLGCLLKTTNDESGS